MFQPVLVPILRADVFLSAVGFALSSVVVLTWALTFSLGGERLFGRSWNNYVTYNLSEKLMLYLNFFN